MEDAKAFTIVCEHLERATVLERPAARGTVRIALKEAGLDPETVTPEQMAVVTEKLLPSELRGLRIADPEGQCLAIRARLKQVAPAADGGSASPEAVFERLAGN